MTPRLILVAMLDAIARYPLLWLGACALIGTLLGGL